MNYEICTDKSELLRYMSLSPEINLYGIGDLEAPFWSHTTYYVTRRNGNIDALVIVYQPAELAILMAFGDNITALNALLESLIPTLSSQIYCHIRPGCEAAFHDYYHCTYHETQTRMIFRTPDKLHRSDHSLITLGPDSADRLEAFFTMSYPGHWFDAKMLDVHPFVGCEHNHQLVGVAGIHVYAPRYQVAALGNITTHPDFRGKGIGQSVTRALTKQLQKSVELIGLNVHSENAAAIRCYEQVGFETEYRFNEMMFERKKN